MVGDTHGNTRSLMASLKVAGEQRIQHVLVLGDFGLWTHFSDGIAFLDDVNEYAAAMNATVYAIGGNHENWDHWNWFVDNMPTSKGFAMVRRRVLLAPKVHSFRLAGTNFAVAGGAVSIDKDWRQQRERGGIVDDSWGQKVRVSGSGPKTLWWPNEELTDDDVAAVRRLGKHDILFTHDCSTYTPFKGRLKEDFDSKVHRQRIDEVIKAVKPKFHFHGHMHTKYEWLNTAVHGGSAFDDDYDGPQTMTYGLECNPDAMWGASKKDWWGIFDTETQEFAFRGEGMEFRSLEV